jgi:outer membrane lipoprotein-sorting protein
MRTIILDLFFLLLSLNGSSQSDKEAVRILDKFSAMALGAPSISMKFDMVTVDMAENKNDTMSGSIILCKNKYKLELPDNIIWFNGEASWSYLPAEREVTISKADKKDNSFQNRPSEIFSMYKSGYKNRLVDEKPDTWFIDLYPEDIKSELLRVRLCIGKKLMNLVSLEYKRRDGVVITLHVKDYNLELKPEPGTFVFNSAKYPGAEVIDTR